MARVVLELTNRCNLRCAHCFEGRHGGRGLLDLSVLDHVLEHASDLDLTEIALTGGEPTLHPAFREIIDRISAAGVSFGLVTNGWNFPKVYPDLARYRESLSGLTFSVDGATEETHDRIRGAKSWRRLLQAMSICVVRDLPFTVNMVVTRINAHEIESLIDLARSLGARGVRFGHLIPTPRSVDNGLYLSHSERMAMDERINELQRTKPIPVALAPGSRTTDLFPCEPLRDNEINIDWQGRLTRCCHLSGQTHAGTGNEVIGTVSGSGFPALMTRLGESTEAFRLEKRSRSRNGELTEEDFFPCDYCLKQTGKVAAFTDRPIWPARTDGQQQSAVSCSTPTRAAEG